MAYIRIGRLPHPRPTPRTEDTQIEGRSSPVPGRRTGLAYPTLLDWPAGPARGGRPAAPKHATAAPRGVRNERARNAVSAAAAVTLCALLLWVAYTLCSACL